MSKSKWPQKIPNQTDEDYCEMLLILWFMGKLKLDTKEADGG